MKNTEFTLKNKLMIIGTTLLVLAMISISFTLWVTWKLEGGAAAINEAGRMRMQTYQLALLANERDLMATQRLIDKFNGGPVGLSTIATAIGENAGTLEEVYEPFLIQEGFLMRTPRGRKATEKSYKHLGKDLGWGQGGLF